jgi:lysozyme
MNPTLRNKLVGAIVGGSGAITIAAVMLGNADGLEGRRYYAYQDVVGVWTVCDGHTGADIRRGHRYTDKECDNLLKADLRKGGKCHRPADQGRIPEPPRRALLLHLQRWLWCFRHSTLLKKLNAGDVPGACKELQRWTYAGGKQWKGLSPGARLSVKFASGVRNEPINRNHLRCRYLPAGFHGLGD